MKTHPGGNPNPRTPPPPPPPHLSAARVDVSKDKGHKVGTEDILLALVEEESGIVAQLSHKMKEIADPAAVAKAIADVSEKKAAAPPAQPKASF